MLDFRQKISLMWMYMRPVLIISGLGTLSVLSSLMLVSAEAMGDTAVMTTIVKVMVLAISCLLFTMLTSKDRRFFYINVGISTRKLTRWAICLDMAVYFLLLTIIILIRNAAA